MVKKVVPFLLLLALLLSACGGNTSKDDGEQTRKKDTDKDNATRTYQSENGDVKVPDNPKRIVVLTSFFAGDVAKLGGNIVGVDPLAKKSSVLKDELKDAEPVSAENVEKVIQLDPDLIIGLSTTQNLDKLKKVAPTVTYTYNKLDYLQQYIAIGKLLGKEKEAKQWVKDFEKRAADVGEKIKAKIGSDTTVSVIEKYNKQFYVYGKNFTRGTEILYQAMDLKMPQKVKKEALEQGYQAITPEAIPKFAGDYIVLSQQPGTDNSFQQTETYQNIPAVKNDHVIEVNADDFHFNDPMSLEYELDVLKKGFLGSS